GRFVPRWTRWCWVVLVAAAVLADCTPSLVGVGQAAFLGALASALGAQVYRYWRRAGPLQRLQIKWIVFGFGATFASVMAFFVLGALFPALKPPGTAGLLYELVGDVLGSLWFMPLALCVGIALLRYQLWGIDWIISKALVYGTLTALLATVYAGLIVGL